MRAAISEFWRKRLMSLVFIMQSFLFNDAKVRPRIVNF